MKGFAKYKQSLDSILENSYTNKKEFKNNLSIIMGTLKFSKPLREFFTLYNEIEIKNFDTVEDSKNYLNEAVRYLRENKKELASVKNILDKIIVNRKNLCNNTRKNPIYENIDTVVFNNNIINIDSLIKSREFLSESMISNKKRSTVKVNPKILSHAISRNYQEEYGKSLSESEQNILKNTLLMTEESVNTEFDNIKDIAINRINTLLKETKEDELGTKLIETKNEINQLKSTKINYIKVRGLLEDLN